MQIRVAEFGSWTHREPNGSVRKCRLRFAEEVPVLLRKSKSAFWVIVVVALLAGSAKVSVARSPTHYSVDSEFYPQLQLFGEVLQRVRSDYVEKPNDSKLIGAAINGMLSSLDPHSYYLNPKALREMQVQTSGLRRAARERHL